MERMKRDSQMRVLLNRKKYAADKGVALMDIDTRLSNRVKQVVDGQLELDGVNINISDRRPS
jgi:hypothetical protein